MNSMRRTGFTLVEVLVALLLLAVSAGALAAGIAADRRLRVVAAQRDAAADRVWHRLEQLSSQCGSADSSAIERGAWGSEEWRAVRGVSRWSLSDTVRTASGRSVTGATADIACRE